jgi:hypothetical protein
MPDPEEVAKQKKSEDEERAQIEDAPMTPSERYALLSLFAKNHRYSFSDMPGRSTFDALTHSRPPVTFSRRPGLGNK